MTYLYRCQLELQDYLYFATREIGRLYETEPILHNYALCYALGLVDNSSYQTTVDPEFEYTYFCRHQVPQYEAHLTPLNQQGIYVTPGRSLNHKAALHTWKYANNHYRVKMEPTSKNIPSFGRAKEIAPESQFEFFIFSQRKIHLPHWIRLGKWSSKCELKTKLLTISESTQSKLFTCSHPLNPLDVMATHQVLSYDTINMPPVSLIRNVQMQGSFCTIAEDPSLQLPLHLHYHFS